MRQETRDTRTHGAVPPSRRRRIGLSAAIVVVGVLAAFAAAPGFEPDLATVEVDRSLRSLPPDNGLGGTFTAMLEATPALIPDGGWVSFDWHGETGKTTYQDGEPIVFTAMTPVTLRITDDFCAGDTFRVYDNDVEIGTTFDVAVASCSVTGADAAFAAQKYASGIFTLPAGEHALSIQVMDNPWGQGRAYLRIDTEHPFATFATEDVASLVDPVHGADRFRFAAAYAPGVETDGADLSVEEVVVWYGRYLEVLPPGSFLCTSRDCRYESDGPGITRAYIGALGMLFEAEGVDLCPGSNPLRIGVWMGDEGGRVKVRCCGRLHD
jgi:hypothetical protein